MKQQTISAERGADERKQAKKAIEALHPKYRKLLGSMCKDVGMSEKEDSIDGTILIKDDAKCLWKFMNTNGGDRFKSALNERKTTPTKSTASQMGSMGISADSLKILIFMSAKAQSIDTQKVDLTDWLINYAQFCKSPNHIPKFFRDNRVLYKKLLNGCVDPDEPSIENADETPSPEVKKSNNLNVSQSASIPEPIVKSPFLPLVEPYYEKEKSKSVADDNEINLSPYDHYSIPLRGRKEQLKELDIFLQDKRNFLILPVIGSSGAGKTRLVTQWLHTHVNADKEEWHAGLLVTSDASKLKNWEPSSNSLIIIDYIYRFNDSIKLIVEKAEQCKQHKIRLILLHHVFPKKLRNLMRDADLKVIAPDRKTLQARQDYFYSSLLLENVTNRIQLLREIIATVSGKAEDSGDVKKALEILKGKDKKKGDGHSSAAHPLFAILIAQAMKKGDAITEWKRRDLIDYYLNNERRLPWRYENDPDFNGKWIGAFVAAATVRRGLSFDALNQCLPRNEKLTPKKLKNVADRCNHIVSSGNDEWLKPFEPDILGGNFFLLFFREILEDEDEIACDAFIKMICAEESDPNTENQAISDIAGKFIEFIQILARNLVNEDFENNEDIKEDWNTLSAFLNPVLYPKESSLRLAVSLAIIEVSDILEEKNLSHLNSLIFSKIGEQDLIEACLGKKCEEAAAAFTKYFDRCSKMQRKSPEFQKRLFTAYQNLEIQNVVQTNRLKVACSILCLNVITLLIRQSNIIEDVDKYGGTALMYASLYGNVEVMTLLIKEGARADQESGGIALLLCFANLEATALLIKEGADVNYVDRYNWTPLRSACKEGDLEVVALLIKEGADVNQQDWSSGLEWSSGFSVLEWAIEDEGDINSVALLIKGGADVNYKDNHGFSPLMFACYNGNFKVAALLLKEGAKVNQIGKYGSSALNRTCHKGSVRLLNLLIKAGAEVNPNNGFTPLMGASESGNIKAVAFLIKKGAKIDTENDSGRTSLWIASEKGNIEVMALLIKKGADVNKKDNYRSTVIISASEQGHVKAVDLLIKGGAEVNEADDQGLTAIMYAAKSKHRNVVELLIKGGATVNLSDENWFSILVMIGHDGQIEIRDMILKEAKNQGFDIPNYFEKMLQYLK